MILVQRECVRCGGHLLCFPDTEDPTHREGECDVDITWTCEVCKDERPDEAIDVEKERVEMVGGGTLGINVRYCNDRPECREGANEIAKARLTEFFGG